MVYEYSQQDESEAEIKQQRRHKFTLKYFDNIEMSDDPTYLIKDILPDIGLAVVFGPEKCGKSFWLLHVLLHVALGWEYRGHDVCQGPVVYLALEGGRGFAKRIVAWRQEHLAEDRDPVPFWLLDVRIDLVRDHRALIAAIRAQVDRNPAVVCVDTLNRAINGSENDPDVMSKFIQAADAIRDAFNCLVVIIHHCPLVGGRPRGHSSLSGADDVQISVEKNDDTGIVTVKVVHMKDDESGLVLASKLKRIEVGVDSKGNPITSCIVEAVETTAAKLKRKLSDANQFGLDLLVKLISDKDRSIPTPTDLKLPPGTRLCPIATWRQDFVETYPAEDKDSRRRTFLRVVLKLQELKLIGMARDLIWLASDAPDNPDNSD
jgi:hypothetical protein